MKTMQEKLKHADTKPTSSSALRQPRSPVVQKKLDEANEALAMLTPESLEKLMSMTKKKDQ